MSKRFIGVDLEGQEARVAILTATPTGLNVALEKRAYESPEEAEAAIVEMIGGETSLGDRIVTALPCRVGLFRRLHFPFREKGKLAAALPLELNARLPVSLEEHVISFLPARARENDYEVDAVVVNRLEVDDLLIHFPDPAQNPRRIDIAPFAFLPVLKDQEGILIYCRRLEVVVALVFDGKIWDYRLLPGTMESSEAEILDFIADQVSQLENATGQEGLPLWVIGAGVSESLVEQLRKTGREISRPAEQELGSELPSEMAPAALMALAEMRSLKKAETLNFRVGEFAARGQLEILRTKMVLAAIMLLVVLVGVSLTMHFSYLQKTREEAALKEQMLAVFRQTMPPNSTVVDVPLQMESHLQELQKQVQLFGLGGQGAATVLQTISRKIDPKIKVDLQEFNYNTDEVRLDGVTDSFDSVNKIAEVLENDQLFTSVEISNAKLANDSNQVDFELQLKLAGGGLK